MSGGKNQRALLMEILIAVLFFGLCAAVLLETFMAARTHSSRAGALSEAMTGAQVLCEELYAAEDMQALLEGRGFAGEDGVWTLEDEGVTLRVTLGEEETAAGTLRSAQVEAISQGEALVQLPCVRYMPGEATP